VILIDTDVAIEILRGRAPALSWIATLPSDEPIALPGYAAMELIRGCLNGRELAELRKWLARRHIVWIEPAQCQNAYDALTSVSLGNAIGVLDALIAQTAIALDLPLYTFNQRHFKIFPDPSTVCPYER
jgi:predicted nucleic acid-binding protein